MCKKHWYFEENLLSSAGQMWLEVAPDCLFLTYRWLESQAHIKKRNQVILKALWLLVPYDPNPTNHLGRCVILLMQNTPLNSTVSHSLQDVCDRKRANLLLDLSSVLLQLTCIFRHKLFVASIPMICSSILLTYVRQLTWICNKFTIGRIVGAER